MKKKGAKKGFRFRDSRSIPSPTGEEEEERRRLKKMRRRSGKAETDRVAYQVADEGEAKSRWMERRMGAEQS